MLTEINNDTSDWSNIEGGNTYYTMQLTDFDAIQRNAENCEDRAWVLEILADKLKDGGHCTVATRRDENTMSWLARCHR